MDSDDSAELTPEEVLRTLASVAASGALAASTVTSSDPAPRAVERAGRPRNTGSRQARCARATPAPTNPQLLAAAKPPPPPRQVPMGLKPATPAAQAPPAAADAAEREAMNAAKERGNKLFSSQLGAALFLPERYLQSRDAYLEGLALEPTSTHLQEGLRELLFEPVTTPCGHTFCKECFARAIDHKPRCPYCRAAPPAAQQLTLPLFVMSLMMPGETMALNIFEPRYRLMVRRVMEGSRRLGMAQLYSLVSPSSTGAAQPGARIQSRVGGRLV
eukprot:XP_001700429.1 predicted protein [Chlamydomonas reinhardtii]